MWRLLTPAFADEYKIVVYDHVGFGRSLRTAWDPVRHRQLSTYAHELVEVIDDLGLSDVVFVGHSVAAMTQRWWTVTGTTRSSAPQRRDDIALLAIRTRDIGDRQLIRNREAPITGPHLA